jgi:uncharacterized phage protein (TIGR02218 family)
MRTVSAGFDGALNQVGTTFARLWTITRKDGVTITLTDHDTDLTVDGVLYRASVGFTSTTVLTSSLSIGSQNVQLTVPLTDLAVTEADLRHRIYEDADAVLMVADYKHPEYGTMTMFAGKVGRCVLSNKKRATIEVTSQTDPNLYVADEQYSLSCRNDLGDEKCRFPIFNFAVPITVTSVIDTMAFTVDTFLGQPNDFFAFGQLQWLTGDNESLVSDVRTTNSGLLSVGLFYPLPFPIQVGHTGKLLPGCDKNLTTCFKKFGNVINFRGEPFAPEFGG